MHWLASHKRVRNSWQAFRKRSGLQSASHPRQLQHMNMIRQRRKDEGSHLRITAPPRHRHGERSKTRPSEVSDMPPHLPADHPSHRHLKVTNETHIQASSDTDQTDEAIAAGHLRTSNMASHDCEGASPPGPCKRRECARACLGLPTPRQPPQAPRAAERN